MPKIPLCELGKTIKRTLDDRSETQEWLIAQVKDDTGLYFDSSYLHKILVGKAATPTIITSICKILEIEIPDAQEDEKTPA